MKIFSIVALVLAAFVGFIVLGRGMEARRTRALESVSQRLGLAAKTPAAVSAESFAQLPLFREGHGGRFRDGFEGEDFWVFDYRFETGQGKTATTYPQTVLALRLAGGQLEPFALFPKALRPRGGGSGGRLYDRGDDPGYRLSGSLPATAALEASLRELAEASDWPWAVQGQGEWAVAYRPGQRVDPADLGAFIGAARGLCETLQTPPTK